MTHPEQSAYPVITSDVRDSGAVEIGTSENGLTKREYFANNAPDNIPDWFKHTEPKRVYKDAPHWATIEVEEDKELCKQWRHDPCFDLPEHLQWFQDAVQNEVSARNDWELQNHIARYFQWRTFYANNLISELNKPTNE